MPYKRNPMRCERICSLARYVIADAQNAPMTAMTQWLERTLDDSANRRISLPEAFLATDGVLRLVQNVTKGLHVNEKIVEKLVRDYLPFIATENLMMAAVKRGGDRQQLHEIIREASMQETAKMKNGESWDLVAQLAARPEFGMTAEEIRAELEPSRYIGRCPEAGRGHDKRLPRADRSRRTAGGGIDTVTNKTVPTRDALRRLPRAFLFFCVQILRFRIQNCRLQLSPRMLCLRNGSQLVQNLIDRPAEAGIELFIIGHNRTSCPKII